ncbi:MAG: aminoglycoside phosphotransferase [Symbiobacteriaceae bacterium]|jgi:hypothetical protein|nr:aminoglycoside phosphotransferase [Symbiobacteriaceae bacterium]
MSVTPEVLSTVVGVAVRSCTTHLLQERPGHTRVERVVCCDAQGREFSVIRKALTAGAPKVRELQFYESDLPGLLPAEFQAVRALRISHDDLTLWLEDVGCDIPATWSLEGLTQVARNVAHLHHAFWNGTPAHDWLGQAPVQAQLHLRDRAAENLRLASLDPRFLAVFTPEQFRLLQALLDHLDDLAARRAALANTLCHQDCWSGNVCLAPAGGTIAWDWSDVGAGSPGDDLALLTYATTAFGAWPSDRYDALVDAVLDAYLRRMDLLLPRPPSRASLVETMELCCLTRFFGQVLVGALGHYLRNEQAPLPVGNLAWWAHLFCRMVRSRLSV